MVSTAGLRAAITNHMPKKSSFGLGKLGKNALMWGFPVASIFAASKAFGFERDTNAQEVKGINWDCGAKAVFGAGFESSIFMAFTPMLLKFFSTYHPAVAVAGTLLTHYIGWTKLPEWLHDVIPDISKVVNEACKQAGVAYRAPSTSLFGSLGGEGVTA